MTGRIAVIDVETPNQKNDRICSLGITVIENGRICKSGNYLIDPECSFDKRSTHIHGITPEAVFGKPTFPEIWEEISGELSDALFAGHYARFDLSVLKKTLKHYGIRMGAVNYIDTLPLSRDVYPELENHKLITVCDSLGIDLVSHDSGSDAHATAELLLDASGKGVDIDSYVQTYDFSADSNSSGGHGYRVRFSDSSLALRELKAVIFAITEDDIINMRELVFLLAWIEDHPELSGHYPYEAIRDMINDILEDEMVEETELQELLSLCKELLDPVKAAENSCACMDVCGKKIVLSGDFKHGSKAEISKLLEDRGAVIKNSVSAKTDIVLVGDMGSDAWVAGNYGTKIKKAMELRAQGADIAIIKESDLLGD